jgi:hypothetical protein
MNIGCWGLFICSLTALLTLLKVDEANCFTLLKYSDISSARTPKSPVEQASLRKSWNWRCGGVGREWSGVADGLRQSVWRADAR